MSAPNTFSSAEQFLDLAQQAGADAADVLAVSGTSVQVRVRDGATDKVERSEATDFGLRVFVSGASAVVSGTARGAQDFKTLAERAVAMAKTAPPDASLHLQDTTGKTEPPDTLELADDAEPDTDTLTELALAAEAASREVKGVTKTDGAAASAGHREIALVTSNGFSGAYRRTGYSISASAIAGEGTSMERDYDYSSKVHFADLEDAGGIGRRAGERAVRALNPRKMASMKCPVIFEARLASSFASLLAQAANGSGVVRGTSFLKDMMNRQVFAKGVSIIDDPLLVRGLSSKPFDAEGLLCEPLNLVEDGVLSNWLLDGRTAAKLDMTSNARAARSTSGQPTPSSTNLWLVNGTVSAQDMIGSVSDGIMITSMFSSGVNMVTGDYSRGAAGLRIENGEITHPVSEITIAGNLKDMFINLTPANDLEMKSSTNAPTCMVEGMTVAGA
ncbi:MAG: TldD/PmbA family protein [Pseudomonadota bacterium]